jgi:hypothetical protein
MHRCAIARRPILGTLLVVTSAGLFSPWASAQVPRNFPQTALRGELVIADPPDVLLNGQAARLSPGSRIRGLNNMVQMTGGLVGQKFIVNYTIDQVGLVHDVWILRDDEIARRPWPRSQDEAQRWSFDAAAQIWTRP